MVFSTTVPTDESHYFQRPFSSPYDSGADTSAQPGVPGITHAPAIHGERDPEFLTFFCDGIACAAPLVAIREALMSTPTIASLPDSPAWFLGIFQLRTEIIGAADIRPLLTGQTISGEESSSYDAYPALTGHERAIIVGRGARSLALLVESVSDILAL